MKKGLEFRSGRGEWKLYMLSQRKTSGVHILTDLIPFRHRSEKILTTTKQKSLKLMRAFVAAKVEHNITILVT